MKYAVYYISTLSIILALALSSTFYGVKRAWADSVIANIGVGPTPIGITFNF